MSTGSPTRSLLLAAALAVALMPVPAGASDPADRSVLDSVAKDLGLTLLARPEDSGLRLPFNPRGWSFFGPVRPYASVGPRVATSGLTDLTGLAAPIREPADDLSKGVGVGAGLNWHLSDRLDLFGEYQLFNMGGRGTPSDALGRRD